MEGYHHKQFILHIFLIFISYPVQTVQQTTVQAKGFDAFLYLPVEANRTCGIFLFIILNTIFLILKKNIWQGYLTK